MSISAFNELSANWAALLWKASWQGAAALLLILIVSRVVRQIPAQVQCWLWRLAFLKLLIAGIAIAPMELRWLPPLETASIEVPPIVVASAIPLALHFLTEEGSPRLAVATALPTVPDGGGAPPTAPIARLSGTSWLLIGWFIGVAACCVNLVWQWSRIRKMVSTLPSVTDEALQQCVAENCHKMRMNCQPELRVSNKPGSPCLIGVVRPVIMLPSAVLQSCSAEALNAALLHELAHIKRRDLLWNWLPALAEVLFFFHPLMWLARREWRLAQEIATDELALSVSRMDAARYAGLLVELVAKCRTTTIRPHLAVGVSETYSQLSRRMSAMMTFHKLTTRRRFAIGAAVLIIAVGGIVPWKLTPREAQSNSDSVATRPSTKDSQQAALLAIEKLGGTHYCDENLPDRPVISISFPKESDAADADLECLKEFPNLVELNLHYSKLSDAGLEHLKSLNSLKALSISSAKITNAGVAHLKGLTGLEILELENARIDDDGLVHLKGMTHLDLLHLGNTGTTDKGLTHLRGMSKLHTLILDGTRITDVGLEVVGTLTSLRDLRLRETRISDGGLEHLKRLTSLQTLVLNGSKITDAGLEHLKVLTNLRTLYVDVGTNVTEAGVQKLQVALPGCMITGNSLKEQKVPVDQVKPVKTVDELIEEFSASEFSWQQADVAGQLVAHGDKSIIPRMEKLLDTPDRGRRCNAALVLAGLGEKRGLTIIIGELEDTKQRPTDMKKSDGTPDPQSQITQDRYYAALLLGQLGKKEAVPALILATTDKSINYRAAISLGEIGDKSAIPALRQMAHDFPDQRLWVGYGLAALGEVEGFDILEETALSNPQWTDRRHAVEALEKIGNPRGVSILTKALKDKEEDVRKSALKALRSLGEKAANENNRGIGILPVAVGLRTFVEQAPVENPVPPATKPPQPPDSAKVSPTPEAPAKHPTYQEIITARSVPDLTTLAARSSPKNNGPDASEAFMDILKLREVADPKSVPVIEKILVENLPTTRILGFAAAQALFTIGTPEAHQILQRHLLAEDAHTKLAIGYTSHWQMKEPLRSQFIQRYLLKNLSKSLVVEVERIAVPNSPKGQLDLAVNLRNASDEAFYLLDDRGRDMLLVRDASGQFIPDTSGIICTLKPNAALMELKPGQAHRIQITINVVDATTSKGQRHDPATKLIAGAQPSGQSFELHSPGRVEFVALIEVDPLSAEQRTHLKLDETRQWWSGRAVSKPITVELALP